MVLEVSHLNKTFHGSLTEKARPVLKDVQFSVAQGKTTGFVGVNGSGKTTSLKCVLGFLRPDRNEKLSIRFFGKEAELKQYNSQIGYLPERPFLYEFLTAEEFLNFHWRLSGGGEGFQQKCAEVLKRVNLPGVQEKRLRQFSKGMMQRIGFAQALLRSPQLLILDEPMSGLDPDGRFLIKEVIKEEAKRGTSIFFSSHYLGDIEELCQDLVIIDQGQIIYSGSTADLVSQYSPKYRVTWAQADKKIEEIVDLKELPQRLTSSSGKLVHVSPDFVALETAFHQLRGQKDSGS